MKVYSRRTKRYELSIDQPFPASTPQEAKMPKNIAKIALEIKAYVDLNPGQPNTAVANNFNVTRARISQLLKIADKLPTNFITKLQETKDPIMLRKFSGKQLLKIASIQNRKHMEDAIEALTPKELQR